MSNIHIKLEYPEVVDLKKEVLTLEKALLETLMHAKNYNDLRKKEFALKTQIKKDFSDIVVLMTELELAMPNEEVRIALEGKLPVKRVKEEIKKHKITKIAQDRKKKEIEEQIEEIKAKLNAL